MSPAEELRAAAKLMRERAEAATPGPWHAFSHTEDWYVGSRGYGQVTTGIHDEPGVADVVLIERDHADAGHIASWHPAVALAVADWLDAATEQARFTEAQGAWISPDSYALKVARAYLSSSTEEK